jgi:cardiolipin synthase A/B
LNQEINLVVYDHGAADRLQAIFHEDLKHAKQITYEEWKSRGIYERLVDLFTFPVKDQL